MQSTFITPASGMLPTLFGPRVALSDGLYCKMYVTSDISYSAQTEKLLKFYILVFSRDVKILSRFARV